MKNIIIKPRLFQVLTFRLFEGRLDIMDSCIPQEPGKIVVQVWSFNFLPFNLIGRSRFYIDGSQTSGPFGLTSLSLSLSLSVSLSLVLF